MNVNSVLTDDEVYRTNAIRDILFTIQEKNANLKLKITLDETISNKLQYYALIDDINRYIDNVL